MIGSVPTYRAVTSAWATSSSLGSWMRMVNDGIGEPRTLLAMATTTLESTPPLMYDTTGTSARSRRFTLASSTSSNSSVSVFASAEYSCPESGKSSCQ